MPRHSTDISGQRFGRLVVQRRLPRGKHPVWECLCDCGETSFPTFSNLTSGRTRSCGCLERENRSKLGPLTTTHGLSRHRKEYKAWCGMRSRCYCKTEPAYVNYGAVGVTMCDRWRESFANFFEDMGPAPARHMIDRFPDPHGNYEPTNCRWANWQQQNRNRRKGNRVLTFNGRACTIAEWAEITGLTQKTIFFRLCRKWTIERTLTEPRH